MGTYIHWKKEQKKPLVESVVRGTRNLLKELMMDEEPTPEAVEYGKAIKFPDKWTNQRDDGKPRIGLNWWRAGRCVVKVPQDSEEWTKVQTKLNESLIRGKLIRLGRIEDRSLWAKYFSSRQNPKYQGMDEDAIVQMLWHGTSMTDPQVILDHEEGFDSRFSSQGFYGIGTYFAVDACYSNEYAYQNQDGTKSMFLARVLIGKAYNLKNAIDKTLKLPPELSNGSGLRYDSVTGGPHMPTMQGPGLNCSHMYVLYKTGYGTYPEYVVTYSDGAP